MKAEHLGPLARESLREVREELEISIQKILADKLAPAIRASHEWKRLTVLCPSLVEIVFGVTTSGFNDGDPEYNLPASLFRCMGDLDVCTIQEAYRHSKRDWSWGDVEPPTTEDSRVLALVTELSVEDAEEFSALYESLVDTLFRAVGEHYGVHSVVRLKVAQDT